MTIDEQLVAAAREAAGEAYAPYSGLAVGAALLTDDGMVYTGANVENASYSLTLCAERAAVVKAVSEGKRRFAKLAIFALGANPPLPCGACLQVLAEFGPELEIIAANDSDMVNAILTELLPHPFSVGEDVCED